MKKVALYSLIITIFIGGFSAYGFLNKEKVSAGAAEDLQDIVDQWQKLRAKLHSDQEVTDAIVEADKAEGKMCELTAAAYTLAVEAGCDVEDPSDLPELSCEIGDGGVCDVQIAAFSLLSIKRIDSGEPALEFNQTITDDRWGTIHLFWYAGGKWNQKPIEHLPNASENGGRKWQLIRGVDWVTVADGAVPRNWNSCGDGASVPAVGQKVYYVVVDNDKEKGINTKRTLAVPYVWETSRCVGAGSCSQ